MFCLPSIRLEKLAIGNERVINKMIFIDLVSFLVVTLSREWFRWKLPMIFIENKNYKRILIEPIFPEKLDERIRKNDEDDQSGSILFSSYKTISWKIKRRIFVLLGYFLSREYLVSWKNEKLTTKLVQRNFFSREKPVVRLKKNDEVDQHRFLVNSL